jgi:hypothetical protein
MENIDFGVDFVAGNSKKIPKNWVLKEKLVEPSMCSHCQI